MSCKSRLCPSCGKVSTDKWQEDIEKVICCTKHRHIVFTVPEEFRELFLKDRRLLKDIMDGSSEVIKFFFKKDKKNVPGMIAALHTFGRDLKWNPHVHMLVSEGYIANVKGTDMWVDSRFFAYEFLRKSWQKVLMDKIKMRFKNDKKVKKMIDECYKKYTDGLYVYAKDNGYTGYGKIARYIGRYISRPAIAESRILKYDENEVTFYYERHEDGQRVEETIPIEEFIKKVIRHVPDRQFKMIRYYGAYARKNVANTIKIKEKSLYPIQKEKKSVKWRERIIKAFNFDPLACPKCGHTMELVDIFYRQKSLVEHILEMISRRERREEREVLVCS